MTSPKTPAQKIPAITVGLRPFGSSPSVPVPAPDPVPVATSVPGLATTPAPDGLPPVSTLLATICALPNGAVRFEFTLEGRIEALRAPSAEAPPPGPLWQHTCFEAFISAPDAENYREYNFSPAGQWAAGEFLHYRELWHPLGEEIPERVSVTSVRGEGRLSLVAEVPSMLLPASPILRLGLAAVVEWEDGSLEYWAVHHPAKRPDFHHADGWTLRLDTRLVKQ